MADAHWRGLINKILYGLIFTRSLDDATVDGMASAMVERRFFGDGPQAYLEAIEQALAHEGMLTETIDTPHSDEQFRDFLERLGTKLPRSSSCQSG